MQKIDILSILHALLLTHCPTGLEAREIVPPTDPLFLVIKSFTTWRQWKKGDPLLESGLLGPVTLRVMHGLE